MKHLSIQKTINPLEVAIPKPFVSKEEMLKGWDKVDDNRLESLRNIKLNPIK